jgi:hypothetical protein
VLNVPPPIWVLAVIALPRFTTSVPAALAIKRVVNGTLFEVIVIVPDPVVQNMVQFVKETPVPAHT